MMAAENEQKTELTQWLRMAAALRDAPEWPADEKPIELIQTHISVLLLSRTRVVKLKKPVNFGFLDYSTPEKRRQACWNEVELNRRLCPDTYIGYGGVIVTDGRIGFSGRHGKLVDHCVWMNRLPADRMLDRLVAENAVTEGVIDRIAARLAEFHRTARRGPDVARWASLAEIRRNWAENFAQTAGFSGRTLSAADDAVIQAWVNHWLTAEAALFERRAREQRGVDGHGDVRCESICVQDDAIRIFDCIEFSERLRCGDEASEAAFLAMDLAARGRPDLGYYFTEAYARRRGDPEFFTLLPFYRCYRAYVRGKVLSFRLNEAEFSAAEQQAAATQAAHYFDWARRYATPLRRPTVIAVCGLSGTGKTTLARALAEELGLRVVSSDDIRQDLFGAAKQPAAYGAGAYSAEANQQTYQKLLDTGRAYLSAGRGVVLDATFRRAEDRAQARALADAAGAAWRLIECQLTPELTEARLAERLRRHDGASDATWETRLQQCAEFASPSAADGARHLPLDTSGAIAAVSRIAADWLRAQDSACG